MPAPQKYRKRASSLFELGRVHRCTDDSGVFDTSLNNEYLMVHEAFGTSPEELVRVVDAAAEAAFDLAGCRAALREARAALRTR